LTAFGARTSTCILRFDRQFTEFKAYGDQGVCKVRGKRLGSIGPDDGTH